LTAWRNVQIHTRAAMNVECVSFLLMVQSFVNPVC